MKSVGLSVFAAMLALMVVPAFAQVCPSVNAPNYPAGMGAGPAVALADLTGPDFDREYMRQMYGFSGNLLVLSSLGVTQLPQASNVQGMNLKNLVDLSAKIRDEQTRQNQKWASWYQALGGGPLSVDLSRSQYDVNRIATLRGPEAVTEYAKILSFYLSQQRDAAQLGITRASSPEVRQQSEIIAKADANEVDALSRWLATVPTATTTTPAPDTGTY